MLKQKWKHLLINTAFFTKQKRNWIDVKEVYQNIYKKCQQQKLQWNLKRVNFKAPSHSNSESSEESKSKCSFMSRLACVKYALFMSCSLVGRWCWFFSVLSVSCGSITWRTGVNASTWVEIGLELRGWWTEVDGKSCSVIITLLVQ